MQQRDFIHYPKRVVDLAEFLIESIDLYWSRGLSDIELKERIWIWAKSTKLLKGNDLNKTVRKIIGKQRTELVMNMLEGYQFNRK